MDGRDAQVGVLGAAKSRLGKISQGWSVPFVIQTVPYQLELLLQ